MRRLFLTGAATCAALMAGYGATSAQVVIEERPAAEVYAPAPYAYDSGYDSDRIGPRVYGYRTYRDADDDDVVVLRPQYHGGCGTYRYWNGLRCVDARR